MHVLDGGLPLYNMNELIKVTEKDGKQIVSARELYKELELADGQFSRWAKSNIVENPYAIENEDWVGFDIDVEGNKTKDFALVISLAKKIAMMSKTEKGNKVRDYFLECEQKAKEKEKAWSLPQTYAEALQLAADQAKEIEQNKKLIAEQKPKAEYFDALVDRKLNINFRDTAKEIGVKEKDFINFLLDRQYLYRDKKGQLKPFASYVDKGLFEIKEWTNKNKSGNQTLITPKGRETFRLLLNGC